MTTPRQIAKCSDLRLSAVGPDHRRFGPRLFETQLMWARNRDDLGPSFDDLKPLQVVISFGWSRSAPGSALRRCPKGTSGAVPLGAPKVSSDALSYVVIEAVNFCGLVVLGGCSFCGRLASISGVDFELSKLHSEVKYLCREVQGLRSLGVLLLADPLENLARQVLVRG